MPPRDDSDTVALNIILSHKVKRYKKKPANTDTVIEIKGRGPVIVPKAWQELSLNVIACRFSGRTEQKTIHDIDMRTIVRYNDM